MIRVVSPTPYAPGARESVRGAGVRARVHAHVWGAA